jgi:ATP-dependent Clp protease ATP-binding subunit ClpX
MKNAQNMRPDQIKAHLDKYVIGQDEAKKTLAVAVYNHYKRIRHRDDPQCKVHIDKSNISLLGPTGCGKTLMVKTIAKLMDVPCYIQDCTKITASGYVGSDVEDCLAGLLRACNYDIEKARKGIVVLDEGDKIARKEAGISITRDVSGECVQQSLLKIVEGDLVGVPPMGGRKHPEQPLIYLDTTDILFILSGAFVGLEGIVAKRIGKDSTRIGFAQDARQATADEILGEVTPEDIRRFGMIPEFIGRFPVITHVNGLDKKALMRILTEPRDAITRQYAELLREDGIDLDYDKEALEAIAEAALQQGTGARGIRIIMEKVMRDIMYDAPRDAQENHAGALTLKKSHILPVLRKEFPKAG